METQELSQHIVKAVRSLPEDAEAVEIVDSILADRDRTWQKLIANIRVRSERAQYTPGPNKFARDAYYRKLDALKYEQQQLEEELGIDG